jgi:hypothetical protein
MPIDCTFNAGWRSGQLSHRAHRAQKAEVHWSLAQNNQSFQRLRLAIVMAIAMAINLSFALADTRANELALNKQSKTKEILSIPATGLTRLNGISMAQLYKIRTDAVIHYKQLLADTYEPNDAIFGGCESNKPWWGILGMQGYGPGQHAIDGPAKESVYILNPYRLVSAELSNANGDSINAIWNPAKMTEANKKDASFPYMWEAGPVLFNAAKTEAEVTYEVSNYIERSGKLKNLKFEPLKEIKTFSLIAYNARDFGYHFMYLDPQKSLAIKRWPASAVQLTQMLHCGGSCGYPGGCNNMSPYTRELDRNALLKLPARAYLKLWKDEPESVGNPADFTFIINFK